jgi:hypothetical protein
MPRKPKDHFAPLRPIVQQLGRLTHDELRDLVDMLQADRAAQDWDIPKRYGLSPVEPNKGHPTIIYGGWQYRENPPLFTRESRAEFQATYAAIKEAAPEAQLLLEDVAIQLHHALAPIKERKLRDNSPTAEGSLEVKYIPHYVLNRDTGEREKRLSGPYLYFRYWTTGGDLNKRKRRQKNEYIGVQPLALLYDKTPIGSDERRALEDRIIAAYKAYTIDDLMDELGLKDKVQTVGFLPDYRTEPNRKAYHEATLTLTDKQRDVLATYAVGLNYSADYRDGIQARKIARQLADLDLLREVTGYVDHRKHNWRLTQYGLKTIQRDERLQVLIKVKLGE